MADNPMWKPERVHMSWVCRLRDPRFETQIVMKDGQPLSFWNEKSAQIKCDALNRSMQEEGEGNG